MLEMSKLKLHVARVCVQKLPSFQIMRIFDKEASRKISFEPKICKENIKNKTMFKFRIIFV